MTSRPATDDCEDEKSQAVDEEDDRSLVELDGEEISIDEHVDDGSLYYQCGTLSLRWGSDLKEMRDSSGDLEKQDWPSLRTRLKDDGYLLLRQVLDVDGMVKPAYNQVRKDLAEVFSMKDGSGTKGTLLTGFTPMTHCKAVLSLLHCSTLVDVMGRLMECEESVSTLDTKWLRIIGTNEYTAEHTDYYRFAHLSRDETGAPLYTCWIPLMDVSMREGPLAMCVGSHTLSEFGTGEPMPKLDDVHDDEEEEEKDRDIEVPPSFADYPSDRWRTTEYTAGDLMIFNCRIVHASLRNESEHFRISIDTRWIDHKYLSISEEDVHTFKVDTSVEHEE